MRKRYLPFGYQIKHGEIVIALMMLLIVTFQLMRRHYLNAF